MDCESFINYFIQNNKLYSIKYGLQQSEFATNIDIHLIIKNILSNYNYSIINCQQSGIPSDKNTCSKKLSYCTNFELLIDNLVIIFGYEFCKYLMYRINVKYLLQKIINQFDNIEINSYEGILDLIKLFIRIYNFTKMQLIHDKFYPEFEKTIFYKYHGKNDIFDNLIKDVSVKSNCVSEFLETKDITKNILNLINNHSEVSSKTIEINNLNDLVFKIDFLEIGYDGSFYEIANDLYNINPNNEELIVKYNLKTIISQNIIPNFNVYYDKLVKMISEKYPDYTINLNKDFKEQLINIVIDYFICFGINIAEYYNIIMNFEKTCRIHFKTIYHSILMCKVKYTDYTPSQKTLIHYSLLSSVSLLKSIEITMMKQKQAKK